MFASAFSFQTFKRASGGDELNDSENSENVVNINSNMSDVIKTKAPVPEAQVPSSSARVEAPNTAQFVLQRIQRKISRSNSSEIPPPSSRMSAISEAERSILFSREPSTLRPDFLAEFGTNESEVLSESSKVRTGTAPVSNYADFLQQYKTRPEPELKLSSESLADLEHDLANMSLTRQPRSSPKKVASPGGSRDILQYASEITDHRRKVEQQYLITVNYMQMQTDINVKMREILVNWLVEVHTKFKLQQETLYLVLNA
jgi:hypothetical protein